jgi:hypothetical protein
MSEDFIIETGRSINASRLAAFLGSEYPGGEIADENFLDWEYNKNPFGKAVVTVAKSAEGEFASQYAVVPLDLCINSKIVTGSLSLNTLTKTEFRGRKLFARTAEAAYGYCSDSDIQFTIGIPNQNSYSGFVKGLHFDHTGNLIFLAKPLHFFGILKSGLQRSKEKKGKEILVDMNVDAHGDKNISFFDPVADSLLYGRFRKEWIQRKKLAVNRTPEYLSWRYLENHKRKYYLFKYVREGAMKAFVSVRAMHVLGLKACVLMDYMSTDEVSGRTLLRVIANKARRNNLQIIISAYSCHDSNYADLIKTGFKSVPEFILPQKLPFIVRVHKQFEGAELLYNLDNWHFMFGDYDIF